MLSREDIINIDDVQTEEVEVPEWGGKVTVKGLSGFERDKYEQSMVEGQGKNTRLNMKNARARLVQACMVERKDGQLKPIFDQPGDIKRLGKKSGKALDRVYNVARKLSGLSEEDMDELTKNSETAQSEDSIID